MSKKFIPILLIIIFILFTGFRCKCTPEAVKEAMKSVTLEYWRVWDEPSDFGDIIKAYRGIHPNINIVYKKFRYDEYEDKLLQAFAQDKGPDVFSIHNTWMRKYHSKGFLQPVPAQITMAYPELVGEIKKEVVPRLRTTPSINTGQLEKLFIDVVYDDVVIRTRNQRTGGLVDQIYGLPLSVDTLVLFYNRDLFNNAGITSPPRYWDRDFQQMVKRLTKQNNKGQIIQSGIALGGGSNINRASDIISVLMMQNGAEMAAGSQIMFHTTPPGWTKDGIVPGLDAFRFFTDFSNPAKEVHSWSLELEDSLTMFAQGKLAMMLGYSYMIPEINALNPKLNFSITNLPQIEGNTFVNFANYWVEVVSSKKINTDEAWDFVQFITKAEQAKKYSEATGKPTALRSLVEEQLEDLDMGVFAEQLLTSKSWYKGYNPEAAEKHIIEMIDKVASGQETVNRSIEYAIGKLNQTMVPQ
ncbi:extracellular solute-binding protein [Patescibacteria group bacterium]